MRSAAANPARIGRKRKRRFAGRLLVCLAILITAVWVCSGWKDLKCAVGSFECAAEQGTLFLRYTGDKFMPRLSGAAFDFGFEMEPDRPTWSAWEWGARDSRGYLYLPAGKSAEVYFPLWVAPALVCAMGILLLLQDRHLRRRVNANLCAACGYNLAGLGTDATCPECGRIQ